MGGIGEMLPQDPEHGPVETAGARFSFQRMPKG